MVDEPSLLRREVLELTGTMAAASGCLGQYTDRSTTKKAPTDYTTDDSFPDADGFDGSVVKTDHLLTDARNADVVIWKNDEGTVFADAEDQVIASGENFSAVVQAAVNAGAATIVIQDGHYVANEPIDLASDTILTGMGTATTIEVGGNVGFRITGTKQQSTPLTADTSPDERRLHVADTTPFTADDLVLINTDRRTDYRGQRYGEIRRITAVDDADNELVLTGGGLLDTYTTANNAKAVRIDEVANVTIRDIDLVGADQHTQSMGILAEYGENVLVEDIVVRGLGHSGIRFASTIYSAVDECKIHNISYEPDGLGYGIALSNAVRNIRVRNNVIHDVQQHCTAVGGSGEDGFPRLLTFQSNEYYEDDADIHFGGVIQFKDNRFVNGHGGIITGADTTRVTGCEFRNIENAGVRVRGDPEEIVITDSQFKAIDGMAVNLYNNPRGVQKLTLSGNDFTDIGGDILRFRTPDGFTCDFLGVTENVVNGCDSNAFNISEIGDSAIENVNFVGNHFESIDGFGVATGDLSGAVRFIGNSMANIAGSYAVIIGGSAALISNNDITNYDGRGLLMECPGLVASNSFADGSENAILLYQTADVYVTDNKFRATERDDIYGVDVSNSHIVRNDVNTAIDISTDTNDVRYNFGYRTEDVGTHTTGGTGGRSFEIPHDLSRDAVIANVWAESSDAAGSFYVSEKGFDTVTVTYQDPPPSGSNNLSWGYEVSTHTT